jgi:hypothetical protein
VNEIREIRKRRFLIGPSTDPDTLVHALNDGFLWCARCDRPVTQVYSADHSARDGLVFVVYCHGERREWVLDRRTLVAAGEIELVPTILFSPELEGKRSVEHNPPQKEIGDGNKAG